MRLFVAIELPEEVKAALVAAQEPLRRGDPPVKWVAAGAMHLTLLFLGETDPGRLPAVGAAMREALADVPALQLRLGAAGAFPNMRRPSTLWVDVSGDLAALEQAQTALAAALETLGFPREQRPFRAHLTLGRVRREANPAEQARLGTALAALPSPPQLSWQADRVVLFQSELLREGPRYTALEAVRFEA
ncbi:MAG TPA: RNA 2',3'-cyclic phosphodiesterase [Roseiflexaceae bacterium]|nr:RNA 2',3'-cyclic phosphodiesterase [Roseiflexaceae bacterium]